MKRIIGLLLTLALVLICALALADVIINEVTFPDEAFRNVVKTFDTDGSGKLSDAEIAAVTEISCEKKGITSLQGIVFFKALESLRCDGNPLETLTMVSNRNLKLLSCDKCHLKTLDISKNSQLESLHCDRNRLYSLDISNNMRLEFLICSNNLISDLNLNGKSRLKYLDCSKNQLKKLNVSDCKGLEHLYCSYNVLTSVDVSRNKNLKDYDPEEVRKTSWGSATGPALSSVVFDREKATVKQDVTITAESFTDVTKLTMYAGSKAVQSWEQGYTDNESVRTWKVTYAFKGAGERELTFKGFDKDGKATEAKKAKITITRAPTLSSVKFAKTKATVKQNVPITAVTGTNATKLTMYAGSKAVRSWTSGWTDQDGKRTWKVNYAFEGVGERTIRFRAADGNGYATAAKTATITITKAPTLSSVKFAKANVTVKEDASITAVTSTNVTKLKMYSGSSLIKSWTEGYTDKDGKRTWKVTYAFTGKGTKEMTFKVVDANGFETAAKTATVNVCALPTLSSVKFGSTTAKVKEEVSITAVTSTSATKIVMYSGDKAVKTWTEKYTDNGSKRIWELTYAFSGAGSRTLTFKAFNTAGTASAVKEASIKITK